MSKTNQDAKQECNSNDGPAMIMAGNFSDGFMAIGPFDCWDDAAEYAMNELPNEATWIMTMNAPTCSKK